MADVLDVWLYETAVAQITRQRGRLRLQYTSEALASHDLNVPLLSISLPLTPDRYTDLPVRAFLDGILPEGEARQSVARVIGVNRTDTFGLIEALGRDSAGAVVIQPAGDQPPPRPNTLTARPLTTTEIALLVANLREAPLGIDRRVRMSMAGVQEKLLLTRMPDGSWGQPIDSTPSTHILKPEIARFPHTVENEAFCMRFARRLGVSVANVDTTTVDGRQLIVVERFDRTVHSDGLVDRVHQEDLCQATSTPPDQKYEEDGGPSLKRIAAILEAYATVDSLSALLRAVTINVLIGNGDAHGKNFSVLHEPSGVIRLAPLYDLMSTLFYGDDRLAMYIDNVRRTPRVTVSRIVNEAAAWGMPRRIAEETVRDILDRTPDAASEAAAETPGLPSELPILIYTQLSQLLNG